MCRAVTRHHASEISSPLRPCSNRRMIRTSKCAISSDNTDDCADVSSNSTSISSSSNDEDNISNNGREARKKSFHHLRTKYNNYTNKSSSLQQKSHRTRSFRKTLRKAVYGNCSKSRSRESSTSSSVTRLSIRRTGCAINCSSFSKTNPVNLDKCPSVKSALTNNCSNSRCITRMNSQHISGITKLSQSSNDNNSDYTENTHSGDHHKLYGPQSSSSENNQNTLLKPKVRRTLRVKKRKVIQKGNISKKSFSGLHLNPSKSISMSNSSTGIMNNLAASSSNDDTIFQENLLLSPVKLEPDMSSDENEILNSKFISNTNSSARSCVSGEGALGVISETALPSKQPTVSVLKRSIVQSRSRAKHNLVDRRLNDVLGLVAKTFQENDDEGNYSEVESNLAIGNKSSEKQGQHCKSKFDQSPKIMVVQQRKHLATTSVKRCTTSLPCSKPCKFLEDHLPQKISAKHLLSPVAENIKDMQMTPNNITKCSFKNGLDSALFYSNSDNKRVSVTSKILNENNVDDICNDSDANAKFSIINSLNEIVASKLEGSISNNIQSCGEESADCVDSSFTRVPHIKCNEPSTDKKIANKKVNCLMATSNDAVTIAVNCSDVSSSSLQNESANVNNSYKSDSPDIISRHVGEVCCAVSLGTIISTTSNSVDIVAPSTTTIAAPNTDLHCNEILLGIDPSDHPINSLAHVPPGTNLDSDTSGDSILDDHFTTTCDTSDNIKSSSNANTIKLVENAVNTTSSLTTLLCNSPAANTCKNMLRSCSNNKVNRITQRKLPYAQFPCKTDTLHLLQSKTSALIRKPKSSPPVFIPSSFNKFTDDAQAKVNLHIDTKFEAIKSVDDAISIPTCNLMRNDGNAARNTAIISNEYDCDNTVCIATQENKLKGKTMSSSRTITSQMSVSTSSLPSKIFYGSGACRSSTAERILLGVGSDNIIQMSLASVNSAQLGRVEKHISSSKEMSIDNEHSNNIAVDLSSKIDGEPSAVPVLSKIRTLNSNAVPPYNCQATLNIPKVSLLKCNSKSHTNCQANAAISANSNISMTYSEPLIINSAKDSEVKLNSFTENILPFTPSISTTRFPSRPTNFGPSGPIACASVKSVSGSNYPVIQAISTLSSSLPIINDVPTNATSSINPATLALECVGDGSDPPPISSNIIAASSEFHAVQQIENSCIHPLTATTNPSIVLSQPSNCSLIPSELIFSKSNMTNCPMQLMSEQPLLGSESIQSSEMTSQISNPVPLMIPTSEHQLLQYSANFSSIPQVSDVIPSVYGNDSSINSQLVNTGQNELSTSHTNLSNDLINHNLSGVINTLPTNFTQMSTSINALPDNVNAFGSGLNHISASLTQLPSSLSALSNINPLQSMHSNLPAIMSAVPTVITTAIPLNTNNIITKSIAGIITSLSTPIVNAVVDNSHLSTTSLASNAAGSVCRSSVVPPLDTGLSSSVYPVTGYHTLSAVQQQYQGTHAAAGSLSSTIAAPMAYFDTNTLTYVTPTILPQQTPRGMLSASPLAPFVSTGTPYTIVTISSHTGVNGASSNSIYATAVVSALPQGNTSQLINHPMVSTGQPPTALQSYFNCNGKVCSLIPLHQSTTCISSPVASAVKTEVNLSQVHGQFHQHATQMLPTGSSAAACQPVLFPSAVMLASPISTQTQNQNLNSNNFIQSTQTKMLIHKQVHIAPKPTLASNVNSKNINVSTTLQNLSSNNGTNVSSNINFKHVPKPIQIAPKLLPPAILPVSQVTNVSSGLNTLTVASGVGKLQPHIITTPNGSHHVYHTIPQLPSQLPTMQTLSNQQSLHQALQKQALQTIHALPAGHLQQLQTISAIPVTQALTLSTSASCTSPAKILSAPLIMTTVQPQTSSSSIPSQSSSTVYNIQQTNFNNTQYQHQQAGQHQNQFQSQLLQQQSVQQQQNLQLQPVMHQTIIQQQQVVQNNQTVEKLMQGSQQPLTTCLSGEKFISENENGTTTIPSIVTNSSTTSNSTFSQLIQYHHVFPEHVALPVNNVGVISAQNFSSLPLVVTATDSFDSVSTLSAPCLETSAQGYPTSDNSVLSTSNSTVPVDTEAFSSNITKFKITNIGPSILTNEQSISPSVSGSVNISEFSNTNTDLICDTVDNAFPQSTNYDKNAINMQATNQLQSFTSTDQNLIDCSTTCGGFISLSSSTPMVVDAALPVTTVISDPESSTIFNTTSCKSIGSCPPFAESQISETISCSSHNNSLFSSATNINSSKYDMVNVVYTPVTSSVATCASASKMFAIPSSGASKTTPLLSLAESSINANAINFCEASPTTQSKTESINNNNDTIGIHITTSGFSAANPQSNTILHSSSMVSDETGAVIENTVPSNEASETNSFLSTVQAPTTFCISNQALIKKEFIKLQPNEFSTNFTTVIPQVDDCNQERDVIDPTVIVTNKVTSNVTTTSSCHKHVAVLPVPMPSITRNVLPLHVHSSGTLPLITKKISSVISKEMGSHSVQQDLNITTEVNISNHVSETTRKKIASSNGDESFDIMDLCQQSTEISTVIPLPCITTTAVADPNKTLNTSTNISIDANICKTSFNLAAELLKKVKQSDTLKSHKKNSNVHKQEMPTIIVKEVIEKPINYQHQFASTSVTISPISKLSLHQNVTSATAITEKRNKNSKAVTIKASSLSVADICVQKKEPMKKRSLFRTKSHEDKSSESISNNSFSVVNESSVYAFEPDVDSQSVDVSPFLHRIRSKGSLTNSLSTGDYCSTSNKPPNITLSKKSFVEKKTKIHKEYDSKNLHEASNSQPKMSTVKAHVKNKNKISNMGSNLLAVSKAESSTLPTNSNSKLSITTLNSESIISQNTCDLLSSVIVDKAPEIANDMLTNLDHLEKDLSTVVEDNVCKDMSVSNTTPVKTRNVPCGHQINVLPELHQLPCSSTVSSCSMDSRKPRLNTRKCTNQTVNKNSLKTASATTTVLHNYPATSSSDKVFPSKLEVSKTNHILSQNDSVNMTKQINCPTSSHVQSTSVAIQCDMDEPLSKINCIHKELSENGTQANSVLGISSVAPSLPYTVPPTKCVSASSNSSGKLPLPPSASPFYYLPLAMAALGEKLPAQLVQQMLAKTQGLVGAAEAGMILQQAAQLAQQHQHNVMVQQQQLEQNHHKKKDSNIISSKEVNENSCKISKVSVCQSSPLVANAKPTVPPSMELEIPIDEKKITRNNYSSRPAHIPITAPPTHMTSKSFAQPLVQIQPTVTECNPTFEKNASSISANNIVSTIKHSNKKNSKVSSAVVNVSDSPLNSIVVQQPPIKSSPPVYITPPTTRITSEAFNPTASYMSTSLLRHHQTTTILSSTKTSLGFTNSDREFNVRADNFDASTNQHSNSKNTVMTSSTTAVTAKPTKVQRQQSSATMNKNCVDELFVKELSERLKTAQLEQEQNLIRVRSSKFAAKNLAASEKSAVIENNTGKISAQYKRQCFDDSSTIINKQLKQPNKECLCSSPLSLNEIVTYTQPNKEVFFKVQSTKPSLLIEKSALSNSSINKDTEFLPIVDMCEIKSNKSAKHIQNNYSKDPTPNNVYLSHSNNKNILSYSDCEIANNHNTGDLDASPIISAAFDNENPAANIVGTVVSNPLPENDSSNNFSLKVEDKLFTSSVDNEEMQNSHSCNTSTRKRRSCDNRKYYSDTTAEDEEIISNLLNYDESNEGSLNNDMNPINKKMLSSKNGKSFTAKNNNTDQNSLKDNGSNNITDDETVSTTSCQTPTTESAVRRSNRSSTCAATRATESDQQGVELLRRHRRARRAATATTRVSPHTANLLSRENLNMTKLSFNSGDCISPSGSDTSIIATGAGLPPPVSPQMSPDTLRGWPPPRLTR